MVKNQIKIFLVLLCACPLLTQSDVKVNPTYPKGINIKTNLAAFSVETAYSGLPDTLTPSHWTSTWGTKYVSKGAQKMILSDDFRNTAILKVDSVNAPLSLVAYRAKDSTCVLFIKWEDDSQSVNTFPTSRDECAKTKVNRFRSVQGKLVSYITTSNVMKYFYLNSSASKISTFKIIAKNIKKSCGLEFSETHDVTKVYHEDSAWNDAFLIYQTTSGISGKYPTSAFCHLQASTKEGYFDTKTTLSLVIHDGIKTLIPEFKDYKIEQVKHVEDWASGGISVIWFQLSKGLKFYTGYRHIVSAEIVQNKSPLAGTAFLTNPEGLDHSEYQSFAINTENYRWISAYTRLGANGSISFCTPRYNTERQIVKADDFRNSCNDFKRESASFTNAEYVDNIDMRTKDFLAVVRTIQKGNLDSESETVLKTHSSSIMPEIDTIHNRYSAESNKLYEIPRIFGSGKAPLYTVYISSQKLESNKLYLVKGGSKQKKITLSYKADTVSLTHTFDIKFVPKFWEDSISESNLVVEIPKSQVRKIYSDYQQTVQILGDIVDVTPDTSLHSSYFAFTPIKLLNPSSVTALGLSKTTSKHLKVSTPKPLRQLLSLVKKPIIHSPEDVSGCVLTDYYVFTKNGIITSFAKKLKTYGNIHQFSVDLSEFNLSTEGMICISENGSNLVLTKNGVNYVAISFDYGSRVTGQYKIIKFAEENDLTDIAKVNFNLSTISYRILTNSGKHFFLDTNYFYPLAMSIGSAISTGTCKLFGKTVNFKLKYVNL